MEELEAKFCLLLELLTYKYQFKGKALVSKVENTKFDEMNSWDPKLLEQLQKLPFFDNDIDFTETVSIYMPPGGKLIESLKAAAYFPCELETYRDPFFAELILEEEYIQIQLACASKYNRPDAKLLLRQTIYPLTYLDKYHPFLLSEIPETDEEFYIQVLTTQPSLNLCVPKGSFNLKKHIKEIDVDDFYTYLYNIETSTTQEALNANFYKYL